MNIKIDEGLKNLIPSPTKEAFKQLEENIITYGCRDALIVAEDGTLVDGHNRYSICTKHEIPFKTETMHFGSREDMIIFICKNQAGRRNLTPEQLSYLRGQAYEAAKAKEARNQYTVASRQNGGKQIPHNPTAHRLGKQYGVGDHTIQRDARFARAVDTIGDTAPQLRQKILSGEIGTPKKQIVEIAEKPERERRAIVEQIEHGKPISEILPKPAPAPPKEPEPISKPPKESETPKREPTTQELLEEARNPNIPRGYTMEILLREANSLVDNFCTSTKRLLVENSTLYPDKANKQKIVAVLEKAEAKIKEIKEIVK